MSLNLQKFKLFNEQGKRITLKKIFVKIPYVSVDLFRKFFRKHTKIKIIKTYNLQNRFNNLFIKKQWLLYNGRLSVSYYPNKLNLGFNFGQFIPTRVMNTGKLLHLRKKTVKTIKKKK